jgi:hypothetical protein
MTNENPKPVKLPPRSYRCPYCGAKPGMACDNKVHAGLSAGKKPKQPEIPNPLDQRTPLTPEDIAWSNQALKK